MLSLQEASIPVSIMVEDESKAMKLFHKLAPAHHKNDVHEKEDVRRVERPLSELSEHIHSHAPHPVVESYVPCSLSLQMCRVPRHKGTTFANHHQSRVLAPSPAI